jgi:hypothetical protein
MDALETLLLAARLQLFFIYMALLYFKCFRVSELLDYSAEELTGKNLYALCHGEDANKLRKSHVDCKLRYQVPS